MTLWTWGGNNGNEFTSLFRRLKKESCHEFAWVVHVQLLISFFGEITFRVFQPFYTSFTYLAGTTGMPVMEDTPTGNYDKRLAQRNGSLCHSLLAFELHFTCTLWTLDEFFRLRMYVRIHETQWLLRITTFTACRYLKKKKETDLCDLSLANVPEYPMHWINEFPFRRLTVRNEMPDPCSPMQYPTDIYGFPKDPRCGGREVPMYETSSVSKSWSRCNIHL